MSKAGSPPILIVVPVPWSTSGGSHHRPHGSTRNTRDTRTETVYNVYWRQKKFAGIGGERQGEWTSHTRGEETTRREGDKDQSRRNVVDTQELEAQG